MSLITTKPAAGSYSLNGASAYAPTHLWMLDEGTGTTAADIGTGTAMDATLQNADQWSTESSRSIMNCIAATSRYAITGSGTMFSSTSCLIVIAKSATNGNADANEYVFSAADGASNNARCGAAAVSGAQTCQVFNNDDSATSAVQANSGTFYDNQWHMLAIKTRQGSGISTCAISIDGGAWVEDGTATIGTQTLTRYGLGVRASSTITQIFDGAIAGAWAYHDPTYTSLDDAWISALYNSGDPWSTFLSTGTKKLKLLAHPSAASATGVSGWVVNSAEGSLIGKFTGASFEASLEAGEAVLKVPVSEFGGESLTTSDTPLVVAKNTTYGTSLCSATVIEE